jgi:hypothetical protein
VFARPAARLRVTLSNSKAPPRVCAASEDGKITFSLVPRADVVLVERILLCEAGRALVQWMQFEDDESFVRWCEQDQLQHAYPVLYAALKRSVHELFVEFLQRNSGDGHV